MAAARSDARVVRLQAGSDRFLYGCSVDGSNGPLERPQLARKVRSADEREHVILASLLVRLAGEPLERFPARSAKAVGEHALVSGGIAGRKHDVSRTHRKYEI